MSAARDAGDSARTLALVDRAVAGDRLAFDQLYTQHLASVYKFVLFRVGDVALAEDLTQEAFTHALRRIGTFTWQGGGFAAWLITIAKNLITDHHKCARTRLERPVGEMADTDPVESVETTVLRRHEVDQLHQLVSQLCPGERALIQARFLDELSITETAGRLAKSEAAVKTQQYRATRNLAQRLLVPTPPQEATP